MDLEYDTPLCKITVVRSTVIFVDYGNPEVPHFRALGDVLERLAATAVPFDVLVVIRPDGPVPGGEARAEAQRLARQFSDRVERVAVLVQGAGLKASLLRTFLSVLGLTGLPIRPFAGLDEALAGHDHESEVRASVDALLEIIG